MLFSATARSDGKYSFNPPFSASFGDEVFHEYFCGEGRFAEAKGGQRSLTIMAWSFDANDQRKTYRHFRGYI